MNKEEFLCRLKAIVREVTCMSDKTFDERFKDGVMNFANYTFCEPTKILTHIHMKKIILEAATIPLSEEIDLPAEQLLPPQPIDVSHEEYDRLMQNFTVPWPRVYMSKEEIEKWWPKDGTPNLNWDKLKEQIEGFIKKIHI